MDGSDHPGPDVVQQDGDAVGHQHGESKVGGASDDPVDSRRLTGPRSVDLDDVVAVHLVHEDEPLARQVDLARQGLTVGLDVGDGVPDVATEVQAGIRPAAATGRPAGEAHLDASAGRSWSSVSMVVRQ